MAPEYGAMLAFFPVDDNTLGYLRQTGREERAVALVREYCLHQRLMRNGEEPTFGRIIDFDLNEVGPSLAGPSRPDQRISLAELPESFARLHPGSPRTSSAVADGDIVLAAITSCTNTSNPKAMLEAGLVARRAVELGLTVPGHVKTSLSPGSRAVTRYLQDSGMLADLERLGFHVVGYGCMTCNGGSGPLAPNVAEAVEHAGLAVCAVLSGNRNFESRVHAQVRAGYLASPGLVVALALVGHVRINLDREPLGVGCDGKAVYLRDLWPDSAALNELEAEYLTPHVFAAGHEPQPSWEAIPAQRAVLFEWDENSTYIRRPTYVRSAVGSHGPLRPARALLTLGDNVSTDHISPVGAIPAASPAGVYLRDRGVRDFNSYGSRRGNHEVMARGTFSNRRLRNHLVGDGESRGETMHLPSGERVSVFEAAERYRQTGTPLVVLAGHSYGMGSSRDWAAKGPWLLGVRAVLAQSFERIHRTNLCAMGIMPLLLPEGESWASLGLTGREELKLAVETARDTGSVKVSADGITFLARADIQSAGEWDVLQAGGTLPYLLGQLQGEENR